MATPSHKISLQVLTYFSNARREILYLQAAM